MKKIKDEIKIRKMGSGKYCKYEIIIVSTFIGSFGKDYVETHIFSEYATEKIAKRELEKETIQARNCGYIV